MMDLGSTLCVPKNPLCKKCPVSKNCQTFEFNYQDEIPFKTASKPKKEKEIEANKEHPAIAPIAFDELKRVDTLAKDCEYFYGSDWKEIISPSEAAKQYIARIEEVEPELLVGHHYTRYLGDLSGGQILKNIAQKSLNLYDGGLDFYEFEDIPSSKEFKVKYRAALDSLPLTEKNNVIVEANFAFRLNMYMFNELSEGDPYPAMTVLWSLTKMAFGFVKSKFKK